MGTIIPGNQSLITGDTFLLTPLSSCSRKDEQKPPLEPFYYSGLVETFYIRLSSVRFSYITAFFALMFVYVI